MTARSIVSPPGNSQVTIVQITPGAGAMFCGNCLRDNALVAALRSQGHHVLMVPLYLPLTLDEEDQSAGTPIFFGGISVFLDQQSPLFRRSPRWMHQLLSSRLLLHWASGRAAGARPAQLGDLTLSMLRGEAGNQARELSDLIAWLKRQPRPHVLCLSNALLLGFARSLGRELDVPVICMLQGEDWFLDSLPEPHRSECWRLLTERAADASLFVAPSQYFADFMRHRLGLDHERMRVVFNGISLAGYADFPDPTHVPGSTAPVLGYFTRMCREKGLDILVEAFLRIRSRGRVGNLRLRVGGSCGPADQRFVDGLRSQIQKAGALDAVEFVPNPDRDGKLAFLRSLSVFSVPAVYGEAFGLYVIEAMAAGVPVVQPRAAAFPELIAATGGGVLCEPRDPQALAEAIEDLLLNPDRARSLGQTGRQAVFERFSARSMATHWAQVYEETCSARA